MRTTFWILVVVIFTLVFYGYYKYKTLFIPKVFLSSQNEEKFLNLYEDRLTTLTEQEAILRNRLVTKFGSLNDIQTKRFEKLDELLSDFEDAITKWSFEPDSLTWVNDYQYSISIYNRITKICTALAKDTLL